LAARSLTVPGTLTPNALCIYFLYENYQHELNNKLVPDFMSDYYVTDTDTALYSIVPVLLRLSYRLLIVSQEMCNMSWRGFVSKYSMNLPSITTGGQFSDSI
jgi:hypothetical protein